MALRDLLVLILVYGTLPIIPFRPFFGLLVFSWLAYMRPHDVAWGLGSSQLSLYVALATLAGLVIGVFMRRERLMTIRPQTLLLIAFGIWFAISGWTAVEPDRADVWVERLSKTLLIAVVTTGLVRSWPRFRTVFVVVSFSLGLLGLKYAVFGLLQGGANFDDGPGGFMKDNNGFALALCMAIPLLVAVATAGRLRSIRIAASVLIPFTVITIIFTFSRGGLLALLVVTVALLARSRQRLAVVLVLALGLGALTLLTPKEFRRAYLDRADTIQTYGEDSSAMGRIAAWKTAMRMSQDYPIFGVGPDNFMVMYGEYSRPGETIRVTHNSFFQLLSENGIPAACLFVLLLIVSLWRLQRLQARAVSQEVITYARMLQISLLGYIAAGMFLDHAYNDLFYHLVGLSVALEAVAVTETAENGRVSSRPPSSSKTPWWKESPPKYSGAA